MALLAPLLAPRSSDEYEPMPLRPVDHRVQDLVERAVERSAGPAGLDRGRYPDGRMGTAATLRALNEAHGEAYFDVCAEAVEHQWHIQCHDVRRDSAIAALRIGVATDKNCQCQQKETHGMKPCVVNEIATCS